MAEGSGITIYPNPATEVIFFSQPSAAYVYSMDGSLVIPSASAVNSLDVTSLVKGSYVVKTVTDSKVSTQIIIKKSFKIIFENFITNASVIIITEAFFIPAV